MFERTSVLQGAGRLLSGIGYGQGSNGPGGCSEASVAGASSLDDALAPPGAMGSQISELDRLSVGDNCGTSCLLMTADEHVSCMEWPLYDSNVVNL